MSDGRMSSLAAPQRPYLGAAHSASSLATSAAGSTSPWMRLQASQSQPPTPLLASPFPRRLLMPTVRSAQSMSPSRSPKVRHSASKRSSRQGSLVDAGEAAAAVAGQGTDIGQAWFGRPARFEITKDELQLQGFTLHAVEKWITERSRPVVTLAVYTGLHSDTITVTALAPCASLPPDQQQAEWDQALRALKSAGARPRETPLGTVMVTSLANFRSDYTLVPIPSGAFLEVRERLYCNINLLRMGCTGRTALTLEEPSDTTKDRFIGAYHVAESVRSTSAFSLTVLTLVKLLQTALSLFGLFPETLTPDGLLCDVTAASLQRWVVSLGEPYLGVEPMERIADPSAVCGLLSMITATRAKLSALGFSQTLPKDPFEYPTCYRAAISAFQNSRLCTLPTPTPAPLLTTETLEAIDLAYDRSRQGEQFKLHRIALNKLDELREGMSAPSASTGTAGRAPAPDAATADISAFVRAVDKRGKEGIPSIRYVWSGRAGELAQRERERERVVSEGEREEERTPALSMGMSPIIDRERARSAPNPDELSSASEAEGAHSVWSSKRVQRKIESWATRAKQRSSVDHQNRGPGSGVGLDEAWEPTVPVPQVVVTSSRDPEDEDVLSSGQISPVSNNRFYLEPALGGGRATAATSLSNLSDFDRHARSTRGGRPPNPRVTSWADVRSASAAGEKKRDEGDDYYFHIRPNHTREDTLRALPSGRARQPSHEPTLTRRRSANDVGSIERVLPIDRMKIDVDLSGQLLVMRRRAAHLAGVISILGILTSQLSSTNAVLKDDHRTHGPAIQEAHARAKVVAATEAARGKAGVMLQDAHALSYETAQFEPAALWRAVAPPRHKVLAARQRVLGSERRIPGSIGRYTRTYTTLDGVVHHVDVRGRTEDEAEEERGLPDADVGPDVDEQDEREHMEAEEYKAHRPGVIQPAPTWLLRLFESWTQRWRKRPTEKDAKPKPLITRDETDVEGEDEGGPVAPRKKTRSNSLETVGEDDEGDTAVDAEGKATQFVGPAVPSSFWAASSEREGAPTPPARCYSPDSIVGYQSD
ncbi:hypothetical protein PENSPDRAFT_684615 [Peniophora sp. CONT]|nr:hypothetical protein PENSPDRAFT_684615 [Peniophora sp. CONT]